MKYAPLLVALLVGCATTNDGRVERARAAINNFQAMCMAAEYDSSYRYDCVKAQYDLCREAFRQHHQIWFSDNVRGHRNRNGDPTDLLDMKHQMAINGCRPGLE